jgi:hypothetical protein
MSLTEWVPLVTAATTVFSAIFALVSWKGSLNEHRRREEYSRKQEHYEKIVTELQALYRSNNPAEKEKFVQTVRVAWVYCPDEVIDRLNAALDAISTKKPLDPQQEALGDAVAAMRKDLMQGDTKLTGRDFRHLTA